MAQLHREVEEKMNEKSEKMEVMRESIRNSNTNPNTNSFKFNAQAPEFVPRSHTQMPISGYLYPCFHFLGGSDSTASDWFCVGDQEPTYLIPNPNAVSVPNCSKNVLAEDVRQKIVKQVEYQFSDMSLLANESMMKHMSKDPDGYVPISAIASTKKIKSLLSDNYLLAQALRSSSELVVSDDGKKARRKHPFTDKEKEELQSRTVAVENLPEDHSHQNLEKIFSSVGSVKTIRICYPQESNSSRSKSELFITNKLHALVEYGTPEMAEKAVETLNDERNWRKGLRVRLLLRCSPKSVLKNRKSEFDGIYDDDDSPTTESHEDSFTPFNTETVPDSSAKENQTGSKKRWNRGRGKGRGRFENHSGHGLLSLVSQSSGTIQCEASPKQNSKGPRMPDGTRGFTMGRGKPLSTQAVVNIPLE